MPHIRIGEAARRKGVSTDTVRRWIARGELAAVRLPSGEHRIDEDDLDRVFAPASAAAE